MTTTAPAQPAIETEAPISSSTVFGTTALVLSIVGIVLGQGLISVAAIVLGFVGRAKEPAGRLLANWGIALGFVGVFGGLVLALLGLAAFLPLWLAGALAFSF